MEVSNVRRAIEKAIIKLEAERRKIDGQLETLLRTMTALEPKKSVKPRKRRAKRKRTKIDESVRAKILDMRKKDKTYQQIHDAMGISLSSIARVVS